jgi:hypothetical protein
MTATITATSTADKTGIDMLDELIASLEAGDQQSAAPDEETQSQTDQDRELGLAEQEHDELPAEMSSPVMIDASEEVDAVLAALMGGDKPAAPMTMRAGASKTAKEPAKREKAAAKNTASAGAENTAKPDQAAEAAPEEPKKKKEPAAPRPHFSNTIDRIRYNHGGSFEDYLTLESVAGESEEEAVKAKAEVLAICEAMSVKEKNRLSLLVDYVSGRKETLNAVIRMAVTTLHEDGKLETGDTGNLHLRLVGVPYSPQSARSMGRNTISLMEKLRMVVKTEKQTYAANPKSIYLAATLDRLGLGLGK